jgi:hypothetical protein
LLRKVGCIGQDGECFVRLNFLGHNVFQKVWK